MSDNITDVWEQSLVTALDKGETIVNDVLLKLRPWQLVVVSIFGTLVFQRTRRLIRSSERPILKRIQDACLKLCTLWPSVHADIEKNLKAMRITLEDQIHASDTKRNFIRNMPMDGLTDEEIIRISDEYSNNGKGRLEVLEGKVSGAIHSGCIDEALMDLHTKLYYSYAYSNPLHPFIFPDCRKMEADVVRMVARLYNGDAEVRGTMTSGGTESILLAMYAYRNLANKNGIDDPQMIVPLTAHAAFDKASVMFGIRLLHIPVGSDGRLNVALMEKAISSETCCLVASAPNFPTGTFDDVNAVAELGVKYGIPVHVDACLGGFLIPFMEEAEPPLSPFDFRLPGVTSISCDMHKYGYAPKGSSLILYRSTEYLHHQFTCVPDWAGGVYATPTIAGSRSGLIIALTWATMLHFGHEEYVLRTREIVQCANRLSFAIPRILGKNGLRILGSSDASVVAFASDDVNVYAIGDEMTKMGWHLNPIQNPAGQHLCVTYNMVLTHCDETFIRDLCDVVDRLSGEQTKGADQDTAVIYGLSATVPHKASIDEVAFTYIDACYSKPKPIEISPQL